MKKLPLSLLLSAIIFSFSLCNNNKTTGSDAALVNGHPAWTQEGNIYEVNVRQYTPEGTFNAFAKHLDRLKEMGVEILWFMPINPISKLDRKGSLGSYYAVADYTAINPEFGTLQDWEDLVKSIHNKGMKVIIDWVPNHTGADHRWLTQHPDFFVKDSTGKPAVMFDWTDTRQLNYKNPVMEDSMIASMKYWVSETGIDGFRCDAAWNVPGSFWDKCIPELRKMKDVFMLAEGDSVYLPKNGFDAVYSWHLFHMMEKMARGDRPAFGIDSVRKERDSVYPANTLQMFFTSNHDENSWNKADYGSFPGPVHAPFAVLTQTLDKGIPEIYSGQEEPVLRAIQFFEKDPISFGKYQRAAFYKTLLALRERNPALSADASFQKLNAGDEKAVYAYVREKEGKKLVVILNFSNKGQTITISDKTLWGQPLNVFTDKKDSLGSKPWTMEPWGFAVYEYGSD